MRPGLYLVVVLLAVPACVPPDHGELGELEQQIELGQGTMGQGTMGQGTMGQGSEYEVWGFRYADWRNSGMTLESTGVEQGHLVARWGRTDACSSAELSSPEPLQRSCGWYGAGWATCVPGTSIRVGAGACELGWSSTDSMMRVCAGDRPCSAEAALAKNDDTPLTKGCTPTNRPSARFTCPAPASPQEDSKFFVMVSPKSGESLFSYALATSTGAVFQPQLDGGQLVGTTLHGLTGSAATPAVVPYEISVVAPGEDAGTSFYTLRAPDGTPLCVDALPPTHDERAIPLRGIWQPDGAYGSSPDLFTFGCTAGVIAKCYRFRYRPWKTDPAEVSLHDYHQTCTRAARADYCGDGESHTVNGTLIDLYDRLSLVTASTSLPLEAVWRRELPPASQLSATSHSPVACLAKKRWETIPLDGCATVTPDPRTNHDPKGYCDSEPVGVWFNDPDNLLANNSAFIDAGLWRWKRQVGQEYRSTAKLSTTDGASLDPAYAFQVDTPPYEPVFIGAIYAPVTSDPVRPQHTIRLFSYFNEDTGDYLTTTQLPPPGYGSRVLEGWIFDPACAASSSCPTAKALKLYYNAATKDYVADLTPPTVHHVEVALLGYLPR